ncbi:MAG: hypothetical protein M3Q69_07925 [Acidobacteriota bacterium]|nr:hypothetical protein [Acidobacteriota bacterium]
MNLSIDVIRDLFRHMQWADAEVWRALHAHPAALEDEKLRGTMQHLHVVQRAFLLMWSGGAINPDELYAKRPVDEMIAHARAYYGEADAFFDAFDMSRAGDTLHMPWLAHFSEQLGRPLESPAYSESFLQLPMHSTYHRGQVNARLRELGGEPPLVDYIAWIWFGRPAPQWP